MRERRKFTVKAFCLIPAIVFLASCSSESDPVLSADEVIAEIQTEQPVELYQDSFVRLNYPADWTLTTDDPNISAQFIAPESTDSGGNPSCSLNSIFDDEIDIFGVVDVNLEIIFLGNPEPNVSFLTVNETSMVRIDGEIMIFNLRSDAIAQYAVDNNFVHQVICVGGVSSDELNLILDSMEIL